MVARAAAAERTHERILDAAIELAAERYLDDVSLSDVASGAGVSVQTVLRHFDGRESLFSAALRRGEQSVEAGRGRVASGDVEAAARQSVADYERHGEMLMRWLAQEEKSALLRPLVEHGRALHCAWIDRVFEPQLAARRGASRARLRAQLVTATDVYTWKLMRRDLGLSRRETERGIAELIAGALEANRERKC